MEASARGSRKRSQLRADAGLADEHAETLGVAGRSPDRLGTKRRMDPLGGRRGSARENRRGVTRSCFDSRRFVVCCNLIFVEISMDDSRD